LKAGRERQPVRHLRAQPRHGGGTPRRHRAQSGGSRRRRPPWCARCAPIPSGDAGARPAFRPYGTTGSRS